LIPRTLHLLAVPAALALLAFSGAHAQTYPSKPIRLVVPFPAGGVLDVFARITALRLGEQIGQQVVVDNRAGASGIIGTELAAKAPPDGYTLLMGSAGPLTINPGLYSKLPYATERDFTPVALVGTGPVLIAVHPSLPVRSVRELIALARQRPGQLTYASAGSGSTAHLATEHFRRTAGVDMLHVPYKGSGPAMAELVGGQVSLMIENIPVFTPHMTSGRIRVLAVGAARRFPTLPEIPTAAESGLAGYDAAGWWGVMAPAATPKEIIARLHAEISAVVKLPDVRDRLLGQGAEPSGLGGTAFADFIRGESAKWAKTIRESGARVD
jgi:tripartite-type tricarboxylate transporter receptor subunit TctC